MPALHASWQRTSRNLVVDLPDTLYQQLLAAWSEPQRHYHGLQHLQECIAHLDAVIGQAQHPGELELAIWLHDAVYMPRLAGNERRSAEWAGRELQAAGAAPEVCQRVEALIMATCHDAIPREPDQQLLVDIDLAILGADPLRFAEYQQQVRAEYHWVPGPLYRVKRRAVLQGFLQRPVIYSTPYFLRHFEQAARHNLQAALA